MSAEEAKPDIKDATDKKQEDEMPALENQENPNDPKKLNRGEKKCRKALIKLGMKAVSGITRVTLKKRDGLIFYIEDPEILRSGTNENTYAIFGELKIDDPTKRLGQGAQNFAPPKPAEGAKSEDTAATDVDDSVPLSEEGLTASNIDMVMSHGDCSRNKAIKALRETNDDVVNAIMAATK